MTNSTVPSHILFENIDTSTGPCRGLPCRVLNPEEESAHKTTIETFGIHKDLKLKIDTKTLIVKKEDFEAFLTRNPVLEQKFRAVPVEQALEMLWKEMLFLTFPSWRLLATKEKPNPSTINVFAFIEENIEKVRSAGQNKNDPLYPLFILNNFVIEHSQLSPKKLATKMSKWFLSNLSPQSIEVVRGLGLQSKIIRTKIAQDACEYYGRKVGTVSSVHPPHSKAFTKKKRSPVQALGIVPSVQPPIRKLPQKKKKSLIKALVSIKIQDKPFYSNKTIATIIHGYENDWKGFVDIDRYGSLKQTHSIKGLKIYKDKNNQLVADFAVSSISKGAFKTAKKMFTLLPDGTTHAKVRYGAVSTNFMVKKSAEFSSDIEHEVKAREELGKIENLLKISQRGTYLSKAGVIKNRYVAELCEGTIDNLIFDKNGQPLPENKRGTEQALQCALGVLRALAGLHSKNYVHKDIKLNNFLFKGTVGLLSDLGFVTKKGLPMVCQGTPEYISPEIVLEKATKEDPSSDLFSFGIALLFIIQPEMRHRVDVLQGGILQKGPFKPLTTNQYLSGWELLRKELTEKPDGSRKSDLKILVANLLNPDPTQRLTAEQTFDKLTSILKKPSV